MVGAPGIALALSARLAFPDFLLHRLPSLRAERQSMYSVLSGDGCTCRFLDMDVIGRARDTLGLADDAASGDGDDRGVGTRRW